MYTKSYMNPITGQKFLGEQWNLAGSLRYCSYRQKVERTLTYSANITGSILVEVNHGLARRMYNEWGRLSGCTGGEGT